MDKMCDACHMMCTPTAEGKCSSCGAIMSHDDAGTGDMGGGADTAGTDKPADASSTDQGMGGGQQ